MTTKLWAIGLIILTTFLTSTAQVFYKIGSENLSFNLIELLTNYNILFGLFLYGIGAILLILSLKGGEVTVLYPIIATSYIWVSLFSVWFLGEGMNLMRWLGVITIIIGISIVGYGSKKVNTQVEMV